MGEFSITHILLFAVIFMLFFGPSRIEGVGKSLGRAIRGFKDGINEIETEAKPVADQRNDKRQELHNGPAASTQTQAQQTEKSKDPHHS